MKLTKVLSATLLAGTAAFAAQSALAYGQGDVFVRGDVTKNTATGTGNIDDTHSWSGAVGYMPMDQVGVELSTGGRERYDIDDNGSFKARPYNLVAQYYPLGGTDAKVQPYVGGGVNYTKFSSQRLNDGAKLDSDTWSWVGQVGVDLNVTQNWAINGFAQYTDLDSDVNNSGRNNININPLTIGGGVSFRF
ncbi:OmpW/AlkL family protein [Phytohalomonas tamaricis]|uniref:OmpW/AlkL family protein n=1 Tax=Phytohalomonas tamaricis TaxID=2081032 RepID=UPI000D0BCF52|nr:OmpW family outer membrane protein [Phytohalomonas tamaricis]